MPTPHRAPASTGPLIDEDAHRAELARAAAHRAAVIADLSAHPRPGIRFVREGANAPSGARCPYLHGSAAATWWQRGRDAVQGGAA